MSYVPSSSCLCKYVSFIVAGKTLQNYRNYVDVKLAQTERKLLKYTAKPTFQRIKIFNEDLVGIECSQLCSADILWHDHFRFSQILHVRLLLQPSQS